MLLALQKQSKGVNSPLILFVLSLYALITVG